MIKVSRRDVLDRYYLLSFLGYGLFLHRIKQSDPPNALHSHPWNGISLHIGTYIEHRLGQEPKLKRWVNFIRGNIPHRVELVNGPLWTLFLHGRRYNKWGVFDLLGNLLEEEPWRGVGGRTSYLPPVK